ncbi:hypothetical protein [Streptomyces sp. NPDC001401]|uniref:hypothetical protein n=1 Tax=Streptomyces sp. NPDC001401 TaxID=3364570 RepID=UPI0036C20595
MRITPAEAAIVGTAVGATATFSAALITQRATTKRDRERRLWDRRVDTYAELMSAVHLFARMRAQALDDTLPENDARRTEAHETAAAIAARVEIYSPKPLILACKESFDLTDKWQEAWEKWCAQDPNVRLDTGADKLWRKFTEYVKESRKADRNLLELLLSDVHGESPKQNGRSRKRFLRIPIPFTTVNPPVTRETTSAKTALTKSDQS